jgi:hypothetical protein
MMNHQGTYAMDPPPRKRHRVFWWVFVAIQIIFIIWIAAGAADSHKDCAGLSAHACLSAADTAHGIAIVAQVVAWCVVDFLVGVPYVIYRLARRP